MSEALRRPIRRNPRLGHAVGRTARCFTQRTYGLEKYTGLEVRRSTWDNGLYVGTEAEFGDAASWTIGVWGAEGYHHDGLPAVLAERWGLGKTSPRWPWYRYFSDTSEFGHWEFGDWRTGTAIIALRDGAAGDYGKRLCAMIVEIGKAVDGLFPT